MVASAALDVVGLVTAPEGSEVSDVGVALSSSPPQPESATAARAHEHMINFGVNMTDTVEIGGGR
jgi:hypothetical protein